jgi:hypothetical protein
MLWVQYNSLVALYSLNNWRLNSNTVVKVTRPSSLLVFPLTFMKQDITPDVANNIAYDIRHCVLYDIELGIHFPCLRTNSETLRNDLILANCLV